MQDPTTFPDIVPVDYTFHTPETQFCWDSACPCHEDPDKIAIVSEQVRNGLLTPQEATDFVNGKTV